MITLNEKNIANYPYTRFVQNPFTKNHNHTFWEILIFLGNKHSHTVNDTTSILSLGDVLFLRPIKDSHHYNVEINKGRNSSFHRHRDIYVSDSDMRKFCTLLSPTLYDELASPDTPVSVNISLSTVNHIEDLLISHNYRQDKNISTLKNIYFSVVITLLAMLNTSQQTEMPTQWLNTLVDNLSNPDNFSTSIDNLIAQIPYSHCHICREFKKYTGQTVVNFFIYKKINHAAYLLANTNMKILDISTTIGYTSPKNFISQFTKIFKLSPSKWRTKAQMNGKS